MWDYEITNFLRALLIWKFLNNNPRDKYYLINFLPINKISFFSIFYDATQFLLDLRSPQFDVAKLHPIEGRKLRALLEKSVNGGLRECNYETFLSVFELLFLLCRFHPVSTWDALKMEVCPPRKRIRTGDLPF